MGRPHAQVLRVRFPRIAQAQRTPHHSNAADVAVTRRVAAPPHPLPLSERYDARKNMFDWDYHMRLIAAGADIVHWYHFRDWRASGAKPTPAAAAAAPLAGRAREDGTHEQPTGAAANPRPASRQEERTRGR